MVTRPHPQPARPEGLENALPDPVAQFLRNPWVASVQVQAQRLAERDYAELLLKFANAGTLSAEQWQTFLCGSDPNSDPSSGRRWMEGTLTVGAVDIVRDQLKQLVKHGPRRAQPRLGQWWAANVTNAGLVLIPAFDSDAGIVRVSYRILTRDAWAVVAFSMVLFMDSTRPFGRDLCQCKLEECRKFFFVTHRARSGRPRRDYCNQNHANVAYRRQLLKRVARSRARKQKNRQPRRK